MNSPLSKKLPPELYPVILDLIERDDVRSVSCPFDDVTLWQVLVEKQVQHAQLTGLPLQKAYALCGPDSGLDNVPYQEWGGEIHVPYEGACGGDLFILPEWHRFFADKVREAGKLRWTVTKRCHHVLLRGDYGEIACATRQRYGDWTLYTSNAPYEPCNPFVDPEQDQILAAYKARKLASGEA